MLLLLLMVLLIKLLCCALLCVFCESSFFSLLRLAQQTGEDNKQTTRLNCETRQIRYSCVCVAFVLSSNHEPEARDIISYKEAGEERLGDGIDDEGRRRKGG
ncbi:hypothetical protein BC567DRAFT_50996 [Phyllosticta citribraziliensis]